MVQVETIGLFHMHFQVPNIGASQLHMQVNPKQLNKTKLFTQTLLELWYLQQ